MSKQSDDIFGLREQMEPTEAFPRGGLGGLKRAELERMVEEQTNTIASMKRVFYRDTEELRDQLMVLNSENRCLKDRLAELEKAPQMPGEQLPPDEQAIRERLRPMVEKLQMKHQQELASLRMELRQLSEQLTQSTQSLENFRAKSGSQIARRQAAEEALERAQQEITALKEQRNADEAAIARLQSAIISSEPDGQDEQHSRHIHEYKQALAAALKQNAQQDELIQTLTRQLEYTTAHYKEQRAQQLDYLRNIRDNFEMFYDFMTPDEQTVPRSQSTSRDNLKPLFREQGK